MATIFYAGFNSGDVYTADADSSGTSSTAASVVEVRMGNGTYTPTQREVINSLRRAMRWIIQGGLDQAGANLPPNRG